jgi:tRNA (guanine-N7-)-methyltransferase
VGKDKLRRFSEINAFQNVIQPELEEVLNANYLLKGRWKQDFFKNQQPLILELGCGKGEYTVGLAMRFPNKNFLGLDIKGARMWRGAKTALETNLTNAAFLRTRIEFISSFFAAGEVDEIWITFPDPQLKERRERKRLTHPLFLKRYAGFLAKGGIIHLKTDSRELYDFTMETIEKEGCTLLENTTDLYDPATTFKEEEIREVLLTIRTFYEQQFLDKGKPICYIKFGLHEHHQAV